MTTVGKRRVPRTAVVRDDIVAAAATVFRKYGYRGATLNDIAQLVGIQKASLYHHISSKEELLVSILDAGLNPTIEALEPLVSDLDLTPAEKLRTAIRNHVLLTAASMDSQAVFIQDFDAITSKARRNGYLKRRKHYEHLLRTLVTQCLEQNGRPDDPKLVTLALLGMCNYMSRWYREDGSMGAEQIADQFSDLALEMVGYE